MWNSTRLRNGFRFVLLLALQILIFKEVKIGGGYSYFSILVYPLFIMLLPIRTPTFLLVLLGFAMGLSVDIFYESLGVHAGASVFSAFVRSTILKALEPRGGYGVNASPTKAAFGANFSFRYAGVFMFLHLLAYFVLEIFTPVHFVEIIMRTFLSFIVSMIFVMMYQFMFNPKV